MVLGSRYTHRCRSALDLCFQVFHAFVSYPNKFMQNSIIILQNARIWIQNLRESIKKQNSNESNKILEEKRKEYFSEKDMFSEGKWKLFPGKICPPGQLHVGEDICAVSLFMARKFRKFVHTI